MMDAFLDSLWEKIAAGAIFVADGFDTLVTPFHFLGPAMIIFSLAFFTVCITKGLNRIIITKRFIRLEKEFKQLYDLRQAAMAVEDREKGRRMAQNIDKGELNRVYYDYFFEGMLLGLARKAMPIFVVFAYVNEYFRPERLNQLFARSYIFKFNTSSGEPVLIGAVVWYFTALLMIYLLWYLLGSIIGRKKKKAAVSPVPTSEKV